ncbi:MAG: ATP-grasp domain-containing protein, partial [Candidatus Hodarchaeota archaeon]
MKLYEYEAKKVFELHNIPIPKQYGVVHTSDEVERLNLRFPVMAKAGVLIGGRGKAGGIKKVSSLNEAKEITTELLNLKIKEYPVNTVFFEEVVEEIGACYVGVTTNPNTFNNMVVVSASGGVDIEEVARSQPDAIIRREIPNNDRELHNDLIEEIINILDQTLPLSNEQKEILGSIIGNVYSTYQDVDAKLCEINPVIITPKSVVAADAKIVLDDNGLYRQSKLLET